MDEKNKHIKDDINFLEYPNWIITERNAPKTFVIEKEQGVYIISTTDNVDRLPDRTDKIILYYMLKDIVQTQNSRLVTTRYNILKNTFGNTSKQYYERIIVSLNRWLGITVLFDGNFFENDLYKKRGFHILDGYELVEKTGELIIDFNRQYLEQLRNTNYFKLINYDEYKRLKKPIAVRLFEILNKTFKDRDIWKIHIIKLAEKLTLEKRKNCKTYYPSDVLIRVNPAVTEIRKNTNLNVELDYNKQTHICTFIKIQDDQEDKQKESNALNIPNEDTFKSLIAALPKEHQHKKTILEAMSKAFRKHGYDYVKRNIEYTNKNCKTNYRAYLNKALKEDFGLGLQEDHETKQIKAEYDKMLKKQYEKYIFNKVEEYKKENFSEDEVNNLYQYISQYYERENTQLSKEAVINKSNSHLAQQIGLPLFDEWKKHHNSSSQ